MKWIDPNEWVYPHNPPFGLRWLWRHLGWLFA